MILGKAHSISMGRLVVQNVGVCKSMERRVITEVSIFLFEHLGNSTIFEMFIRGFVGKDVLSPKG